jgi:hypothetical protein
MPPLTSRHAKHAKNMSLFTLHAESDFAPRRQSETYSQYLERSSHSIAAAIRRLLDTWLSAYPSAERSEIVARFRSRDDTHFQSAFFELFLYTVLSKIGYEIEVHPMIAGSTRRRPDFLLHGSAGERTYLEAVLATELSKEEQGGEALIAAFLDRINAFESPNFFVNVKWNRRPKSAPPVSEIRGELLAWLGSLDPDVCEESLRTSGLDRLPILRWEHGGWKVRFQAHPKSARLRGQPNVPTLGIQMGGIRRSNASKAIRHALKRKVSRYGKLGCPFIVAVNSLEPAMDAFAINEALFGTEQIAFVMGPDGAEQAELNRADDGVLIGTRSARNTRISAILLATGLVPTTIASTDSSLCLYHNPWAEFPYHGPLCRLPQVKAENGKFIMASGLQTKDLLDVDPAWLYE